jgi:hypothetical protein
MAKSKPRTINSPLYRRACQLDPEIQKLPTLARLVYCGVVQSMDACGSVPGLVFATPAALADELGLSDRQVQNALRRIAKQGVGFVCSRHGAIFFWRELGVEQTKIGSENVWAGTKKVLRRLQKTSIGAQSIAAYQAHMQRLGDNRDLAAELAEGGDPSPRPLPSPSSSYSPTFNFPSLPSPEGDPSPVAQGAKPPTAQPATPPPPEDKNLSPAEKESEPEQSGRAALSAVAEVYTLQRKAQACRSAQRQTEFTPIGALVGGIGGQREKRRQGFR